jgi:dolichol-phosphate mannosyltransferase
LVSRIRAVSEAEIVVVDDDSPDGTASIAKKLGCIVLNRKGRRRGLSAAVIDALCQVDSGKVVVMDADLQHPPELLPAIVGKLDEVDMVIASREARGGSYGDWSLKRRAISLIARLLAKPLLPKVSDPMTGYFGIRRSALPDDLRVLSPRGFKIMLELLGKGKVKRVAEVPLEFGARRSGESKLKGKVIRDYLLQLVGLYLHKFRWLRFGLVGAIGAAIGFPVLYGLTEFAGLFYLASAVIAIVSASTSNYYWNNRWTFQEKKRAGLKGHLIGWFNYQWMSAAGDGLYLGLLALLTELFGLWYMLSAVVSLAMVFAFKFWFANTVIWRKKVGQVASQ